MIKIRPETGTDTLVVEASGKLTAKDYEDIFIPKLDQLIQQHKKIRIVIYFTDSFDGVELGAMWEDAKFGLKHKDDVERMAIVGGPQWMAWMTKVGSHFMPGKFKVFVATALQEAISWATQEA
ncbi:MAG TPA: STAS/SEC14 domain-containing protein [Candidatus Didemnitutus sp.]|jgi:hypothetical protein